MGLEETHYLDSFLEALTHNEQIHLSASSQKELSFKTSNRRHPGNVATSEFRHSEMSFNAEVSNNLNNAGTQHRDQHPCEVLTASNIHSALPHATCMLLPVGLNIHICALSVHFCKLHLQGNVEMKDLPLPVCILFLLAMWLHSGSSIWFHFVGIDSHAP